MYNRMYPYGTYSMYNPSMAQFGGGSFSRMPQGIGGITLANRPRSFLGLHKGSFQAMKTKFNFTNLLSNAQKTLSVINQAIPIVYQVKPIWNNAKTMFNIMGALKSEDKQEKRSHNTNHVHNEKQDTMLPRQNSNSPQFFI